MEERKMEERKREERKREERKREEWVEKLFFGSAACFKFLT
jgi:hypothetical protein